MALSKKARRRLEIAVASKKEAVEIIDAIDASTEAIENGGSGTLPADNVTGTGNSSEIGFWANNNSELQSSPNLSYDVNSKSLVNNGLHQVGTISINLLNNQVNTLFHTFPKSFSFVIIEYGITRGTSFRVGRLMVVNNGSAVSVSDDFTETSESDVTFSGIISGSDVVLRYSSTDTGMNPIIKIGQRRWS